MVKVAAAASLVNTIHMDSVNNSVTCRRILSVAFRQTQVTFLTIAIFISIITPAYAQTGTPMGDVLCTVLGMIIKGSLAAPRYCRRC